MYRPRVQDELGGRDALLVMFVFVNRDCLVGHLYLGSTLMENA